MPHGLPSTTPVNILDGVSIQTQAISIPLGASQTSGSSGSSSNEFGNVSQPPTLVNMQLPSTSTSSSSSTSSSPSNTLNVSYKSTTVKAVRHKSDLPPTAKLPVLMTPILPTLPPSLVAVVRAEAHQSSNSSSSAPLSSSPLSATSSSRVFEKLSDRDLKDALERQKSLAKNKSIMQALAKDKQESILARLQSLEQELEWRQSLSEVSLGIEKLQIVSEDKSSNNSSSNDTSSDNNNNSNSNIDNNNSSNTITNKTNKYSAPSLTKLLGKPYGTETINSRIFSELNAVVVQNENHTAQDTALTDLQVRMGSIQLQKSEALRNKLTALTPEQSLAAASEAQRQQRSAEEHAQRLKQQERQRQRQITTTSPATERGGNTPSNNFLNSKSTWYVPNSASLQSYRDAEAKQLRTDGSISTIVGNSHNEDDDSGEDYDDYDYDNDDDDDYSNE